ncbi:Ryncolin-4 [Holothuria leucospilota]|uniref:Ryncolin-4 n=1 Tax=Holothuria leucospilota TaxID=206669 RepID=A0A9Q1BWD2_HOLLE|nr:Ryncolin-4 [Holothuria leucospilota]
MGSSEVKSSDKKWIYVWLAICLSFLLGMSFGYFIGNGIHRYCTYEGSDNNDVNQAKNETSVSDFPNSLPTLTTVSSVASSWHGTAHSSTPTNPTVTCPPNMIFGECTCRKTCDDPDGVSGCYNDCGETGTCVCPDGFLMKGNDCIPRTECGCFLSDADLVLSNGDKYVTTDCTSICYCSNDTLTCTHYECSQNEICREENGVRGCHCYEGYDGDCGTLNVNRDCYDIFQQGYTDDGVYTILPSDWPGAPFNVLCNMTSDGGGWTVFQRRIDGETDFYRNWESYKHGFGFFEGDFWLGNDQLHYLTQQGNYELRVDLVTSENMPLSQTYPSFRIANESEHYRLLLSNGDMGRTGMGYNNGRNFSTFDRDNDRCSKYNCAEQHKGAWWYGPTTWCNGCYWYDCGNILNDNCYTACSDSNLNGDYKGGNGQTIIWYKNASGRYCNIKYADMKIRPRQ